MKKIQKLKDYKHTVEMLAMRRRGTSKVSSDVDCLNCLRLPVALMPLR